jgi:hypothetical protein
MAPSIGDVRQGRSRTAKANSTNQAVQRRGRTPGHAPNERPKDRRPELAERYQNIAVDKIVINGDKATIRGSYGRLAVAVQGSQKAGLDQVAGFMGEWRARRDYSPLTRLALRASVTA